MSEEEIIVTDSGMDKDTMIMISVGILLLLIYVCYCYWGSPSNKDKKVINDEEDDFKRGIDDLKNEMDDPVEIIKQTHSSCPVMGGPTRLSSCVHSNDLNSGFIISVCCEKCISEIQNSLNNDGEYSIKEVNNMNILFRDNNHVQVTPICNEENMKLITELVGTEVFTE
jgi:hypothetical protein